MMNHKRILYTIGQVLSLEAFFLLMPMLVCVFDGSSPLPFLFPAAIAFFCGSLLTILCRRASYELRSGDGMIIVSGAWLSMSLIGALPFLFSGATDSYVDALFETISGFTTCGASVFPDVTTLGRGLLFWRSFTHWIGGMGVLVFVLSIAERSFGRSIHILRAEMAGPDVDKVAPTARATTKWLYYLYILFTVAQILCLRLCRMSWFESICHALATAGTGGFGTQADSLASFSPAVQIVCTVFMLLFGISFNFYFLLLAKKWSEVKKQDELWLYLCIVAVAAALVTLSVFPLYSSAGEAIRAAVFAVASMITTTGFATADYAVWPTLAKTTLFFLMICGGCIGSTAGGLKIGRVLVLFRTAKNEITRVAHPRAVKSITLNGKRLDNVTTFGITTYFVLYIIIIFATFLLLSFDTFDFETNLSVAVSCVNNIGPGFGSAGPMAGYAGYSDFSTLVLCVAMLLGRLEIYPLLACFLLRSEKKG